jgi:DNA-directed RNA polymerase specialized sigma24 family protein
VPRIVGELSLKQQRACEAYYDLGLTDAQAAERFSTSRDAIAMRRHRARRRLASLHLGREQMERYLKIIGRGRPVRVRPIALSLCLNV